MWHLRRVGTLIEDRYDLHEIWTNVNQLSTFGSNKIKVPATTKWFIQRIPFKMAFMMLNSMSLTVTLCFTGINTVTWLFMGPNTWNIRVLLGIYGEKHHNAQHLSLYGWRSHANPTTEILCRHAAWVTMMRLERYHIKWCVFFSAIWKP